MITRLTRRAFLVASSALAFTSFGLAQEDATGPAPAAADAPGADFDTSYRPSMGVSARLQREFLDGIRWSAGAEARESLAAAFAEKSPTETWLELVEPDGLEANNVADALTAYWVLNWITANGAYTAKLDNAPIQRQLRIAFSQDRSFQTLSDQQKQELAEGYVLNFLVEHAALNNAVRTRNVDTLNQLASASVLRFQRNMGVDLLALVPSTEGFRARTK